MSEREAIDTESKSTGIAPESAGPGCEREARPTPGDGEGDGRADDRVSVRDLLALHDFRLLWLGQIISNFGDAVTGLATLFLVNELTGGDTTAIAAVAIAQAIPRMTIGLVAGVYVDRLDRKAIMIASDLIRALLVLGLVFVDSTDDLWLLFGLLFLVSTAGSFFMPARTAYIPLVVPSKGLLAANSLSQSSFVIAGVLGAAFAGWSVGTFGSYWQAFVADSLTFLASAALLSRVVTVSVGSADGDSSARAVLNEMLNGFRVLASSRILMGVLASMAVAMLGLGMVNVLIVPLVVNDLQVRETWFAVLQLAQSVSMVLSGALVAVLAARFKSTRIASVCLFCVGVAVALVAGVSSVAGLIVVLFAVGWFMTPLQASLMTLLQNNVVDAMRGRAGAALSMAAQTASVVSMAGAGVLSDAIGPRNVFLLGGAITAAAGVLSAVIFHGQDEMPQSAGPGGEIPRQRPAAE